MFRDICELEDLNRRFNEHCSGLVMDPGSLFRLAHQYYPAWLIGETGRNREWLERESINSYIAEWEGGDEASNKAVEEAIKLARLKQGNKKMNQYLAKMVVNVIREMATTDRVLRICDVGAGAGDTIQSILNEMDLDERTRRLVVFLDITLIEPSRDRVKLAEEKIEQVFRRMQHFRCRYQAIDAGHEFLTRMGDGAFDVIISNAVFHHMSYPTYLHTLSRKLGEDGVLAIGDWYTKIWSHPAFFVEILEGMEGSNPDMVHAFMDMFHITPRTIKEEREKLTSADIAADKDMLRYVKSMPLALKEVHPKSRLLILEAHESLQDRVNKIRDAGFETEIEELREKHRAFAKLDVSRRRLIPRSDIATVLVAAKIPGHKPKGRLDFVTAKHMRERR